LTVLSSLILLASITFPPTLLAQGSEQQQGQELGWPRVLFVGAGDFAASLSIFEPQIEKWDSYAVEALAAVEVKPVGSDTQQFGVIWIKARTDVDKAARVVALRNIQVTKARFPAAPDKTNEYLGFIRDQIPFAGMTVALDQFEASFAASHAAKMQATVQVKNDPPRILFSKEPSLLILVDGQPIFRPIQDSFFNRVFNTHAIILKDWATGRLYLTAMNRWYEATTIEGPWSVAKSLPDGIEQAKARALATKQVDPIEPAKGAKPLAMPPVVYVSTVPAELIQTEGEPQLQAIEGTNLMEVTNSDNAIFTDANTKNFYVLISGRWFMAKSLNGPWQYVPGKSLPADFAKIPAEDPKANVLVSVPGTPQAQEAVIANSVPQTAAVKRSDAKLTVVYAGIPQFKPIEGTPLQYAVNTALPVIRVNAQAYYCVQNGVWFVSRSPTGPWAVATSVPQVIYTIPPSSPVYYVTYVQIYEVTPEVVYTGYTPGYLGTVVSPDNVVVYGTGYYYPPYVGPVYIGYPCTYGFGWGFACGTLTGFGFGWAAGAAWGAWLHPWWGPCGWGWGYGYNYSHVSWNHVNVYNHWRGVASVNHSYGYNAWTGYGWSHSWASSFNPYSGRRSVAEGGTAYNAYSGNYASAHRGASYNPTTGTVTAHRGVTTGNVYTDQRHTSGQGAVYNTRTGTGMAWDNGNVYADKDGNVYRYNQNTGWNQFGSNGWQSPARGSFDEGFLNREQYGRGLGEQRAEQFSAGGGFSSFRGGGFGGFRGGRR
jgi:hypothetical protein